MNSTCTIFKREFLAYFRSPVAYVFLIVFLVAQTGLTWYVGGFFESNAASLERFFAFIPWVFVAFIPAVGMRLWAEEKREGTWELLFTLPLSTTKAVLGKFFAGWAFISLALLLTFPMVATLFYLGSPDLGPILTSYTMSILMASSFLAICSLMSAATRSQVISFVLGLIVCLVLVLTGWSVFNNLLGFLPVWLVDILSNFTFLPHFSPAIMGLVTFADVVYFTSVTAFCLLLNVILLER